MSDVVYSTIGASDLHKLSQTNNRFLLLDVREEDEFEEYHSTLSRSLPLSRLMEGRGLEEIRAPKEEPIYIICRSGRRSAAACEYLHAHGYQKLVNVEGGMEAWIQAGLPHARG